MRSKAIWNLVRIINLAIIKKRVSILVCSRVITMTMQWEGQRGRTALKDKEDLSSWGASQPVREHAEVQRTWDLGPSRVVWTMVSASLLLSPPPLFGDPKLQGLDSWCAKGWMSGDVWSILWSSGWEHFFSQHIVPAQRQSEQGQVKFAFLLMRRQDFGVSWLRTSCHRGNYLLALRTKCHVSLLHIVKILLSKGICQQAVWKQVKWLGYL